MPQSCSFKFLTSNSVRQLEKKNSHAVRKLRSATRQDIVNAFDAGKRELCAKTDDFLWDIIDQTRALRVVGFLDFDR